MSLLQSIDTGSIRFLDNAIPQLTSGTYNINVTHQVQEPVHQINSTYTTDQKIIVKGPRFSITEKDVQSKFPAVGKTVDCHKALPFITLNSMHLPWSRVLNNVAVGTPWIALMIFADDQLIYTAPPTGPSNPTLSVMRNITDVVNYTNNNIIGPQFTLDLIEKESEEPIQTNTIDIMGTTFMALMPTLTELPYLTHVRQINSDPNTADDTVGDLYYSTILGNRLGDPANNVNYVAHLVSLEGWEDYLPGTKSTTPKQFTTNQNARLISLYSWHYTGKPAGPNFKAMVDDLDVNTLQLPFAPTTWGDDPTKYTPAQKETQTKYANGYVALNYAARTGEKTFAWYRGPFTPVIPVVIKNTVPVVDSQNVMQSYLGSADQAIIYDPATGIFDHSYAIAWELGRLTTLSNRSAALAMWQWKKEGIQKLQTLNKVIADQQKKKKLLMGENATVSLQGTLNSMNWGEVEESIMNNLTGQNKFADYLGTTLGQYILGGEEAEQVPLFKVLDPSGLKKQTDNMPGLLNPEELHQALQNGTDPHVLLSNKVSTPGNE